MTPRPAWQLLVFLALTVTALQGCATAYQDARRESQIVRDLAMVPSDVAVTRRAHCVRRELTQRGADPSRLRLLPDKGQNVSISSMLIGPDTPQIEFDLETKRVLSEAGFGVILALVPSTPDRRPYIVSVNLTAFSPLTQSTSGVDEVDLVFLSFDRDLLVAQGSVRATAVIYAWDGNDYTVWTTAQSKANFYQIKNRRNLNVALTTGRATAGTGRERIEVASVQDAGIVVVHDAVISAISKALVVNC
jgi:hypothetical protein